MTKPLPRFFRLTRIFVPIVALGLGLLFWPARELRSDNFVFYFPNARHLLPLETSQDTKYLPLLQVLNLMGKVTGLQEKRNTLKVWFGDTQLELRADERKVRVEDASISLSKPVRVSNGQWVVPVDFLTSALPRLTHQVVEYQVGTNRIFIGDVRPNAFSVRLDELPNGARLTVQFTDKVTVRTTSSDGRWVMFLGDRPIEPLEPSFRFQNPYVSELQFDDQDGVPKLILTPATTGLNFYPVSAEGGKILLADVLKPPPTLAQQPRPGEPSTTPGATTPAPQPGVSEEVPAGQPGALLPVVVLDAGHGGDDAGARSRDGVTEKDLAAQIVMHVRQSLLSSQKYRIVLTRTGDVTTSFEQRVTAANVARAAFFLSFHAGDLGSGTPRVAIFSYRPPSPPLPLSPQAPRLIFVPWNRAQQAHLEQSRRLAQALQQQVTQMAGVTANPPEEAPARTLRSVNGPAAAIEVGSLTPDTDAAPLTDPNFQQQLAAAVTRALEALGGGA